MLTGGDDASYARGLASSLIAHGVVLDFIGSDSVDGPELHGTPLVRFLNLRGNQREDAPISNKVIRLVMYYIRLLKYAVVAEPPIFHILWNNKFELIDRTLLMFHYRLLGRKIVFTAHNVNRAKRDSQDSALNRLSLRCQYRLASHIFVHTDRMKAELAAEFGVSDRKVSVIPFGINSTTPLTDLSTADAKERLGLRHNERAILFFGQIAPYKGLTYLVAALPQLLRNRVVSRLIIAGKVKKGHEDHWQGIEQQLGADELRANVVTRIEHIPDEEVELYFKAGDVLVMPYTSIFQSGVLFQSYGLGLPVIASDVGSLRDDVIEGKTGFICKPRDTQDLARAIERYFASDMYRDLEHTRCAIRAFAHARNSWTKAGGITASVYRSLLTDA